MPKAHGLIAGDEFDDDIDENDADDVDIRDPFDPREIDIAMEVQSVRVLVELLEDNHVDLNTEFQRSPDLWASTKMSRLIESFLIRLPVPPFYFAALITRASFGVTTTSRRFRSFRTITLADDLRALCQGIRLLLIDARMLRSRR